MFAPDSLREADSLRGAAETAALIEKKFDKIICPIIEDGSEVNLKGLNSIPSAKRYVDAANTTKLNTYSIVGSLPFRLLRFHNNSGEPLLIAEENVEINYCKREAFEIERVIAFSNKAYAKYSPNELLNKYGLLIPMATLDPSCGSNKSLVHPYINNDIRVTQGGSWLRHIEGSSIEHLALKMISSVMKLHELGFVHGLIEEIKFLFTETGEVHLSDFSKSGKIGKDILINNVTDFSNYDPEIIMQLRYTEMGRKVYADPRMDCFALEKVLYEMLTGIRYKINCDDASMEEFIESFSKMERPLLPELDRIDVSIDLKELIKDLLTPHRKDRPYGRKLLENYPNSGLLNSH